MDETTLTLIREAYNVAFDVTLLGQVRIILCRPHLIDRAPYLIHTNYELLLLLDGRKKLTRMSQEFPPFRFESEDRFDEWVERGALHRKEVMETFGEPIRQCLDVRTVFYTLPGEAWRIPAMELIWNTSRKSGGWTSTSSVWKARCLVTRIGKMTGGSNRAKSERLPSWSASTR